MDACMAVAEDEQGIVIAHILTVISYHHSLIPPLLYSHGHIYGDGEYAPQDYISKEELFAMCLDAIATKYSKRMCLYIEVSDLSQKMFGYEALKRCGFFRVQWQEVHNSLHSMPPVDRLSPKMTKEIQEAKAHSLTSTLAQPETEDMRIAYKLLKAHLAPKLRRSIPPRAMIEEMVKGGYCNVFVSKWSDHIIGTCVCIYSQGNAYMWLLASRRKTFLKLHPDTFTVWTALTHAHSMACAHMYFMDVGMPFKRGGLRDFILGFGGKPVSKYRWFKTPFAFINNILGWCLGE